MMNTTQNITEYDEDDEWYYAIEAMQTAVGILLFLLTETGNILTIVAVVKYRSLQKPQYFFIPRLATADALLGIAAAFLLAQVRPLLYVRTPLHLVCENTTPSLYQKQSIHVRLDGFAVTELISGFSQYTLERMK